MSGLARPITVLTAPYNVINNPNIISIDSRLSCRGLKEANQTPNYDLVSNPIKPKEYIEYFENTGTEKEQEQETRIETNPESRIETRPEFRIEARPETIVETRPETRIETNLEQSNSTLVDNNLVDTVINNYLSGKTDYYDNKNQMVDNTIPYDPLKSLVKNYLQDNISMYDNRGKYFDQYLFNKKFDEYVEQKNKERLLKEKVRLYDLNKVENIEIQPYDLPLNKILINTKNTWFNMYDDVLNKKNPIKSLDFKSFFYIGITLIIVVILYVLLSYIFD